MLIKLHDNYSSMYHNIVYQAILYLEKNQNIKSLVVGLSGGIDSALTAILARRVCAAIPNRNINLIGISIPIESNKQDEIKRAEMIGKLVCHEFHTIDLTEQWKLISETIESKILLSSEKEINLKIRKGNSKARLRMIYLYNYAHAKEGLVLSTDNLTEYYLGFWTLHGDVGDFGFIQDLWKTEVYGLSNWINESFPSIILGRGLKDTIEAIPTDGLGITNSDLDQLVPGLVKSIEPSVLNYRGLYEIVDEILIQYCAQETKGYLSPNIICDRESTFSVINRHKNSEFKRNNPAKISREKIFSK